MREYDSSATEINAKPGEELAISLDAVPTAGYQWSIVDLPDFVELVGSETAAPTTRDVGGETRQRFVLRAHEAGSGELRLAYGRPWEEAPMRELRIRVDAG